jgi:hypothetical protein
MIALLLAESGLAPGGTLILDVVVEVMVDAVVVGMLALFCRV